ncbi:hypothetical protein ACHAPO_011998 [Fusarium lateritium]
MGDFSSFSTYYGPSATELVNRPDKTYAVKGQSEFLAVAVELDVPVLSAQNNVVASTNIFSVGAGASFAVYSSMGELNPNLDLDFINSTPGVRSWIQEAVASKKFRRYVMKKIVTAQGRADDSHQLAAAINELRILSDSTIRQCDYIVSMLAVSWSESPDLGRFWPQVILEAADHGTLADYLSATETDLESQLCICMDIGRALEFLHPHGIVHSDLKPANVLVFNSQFDDYQDVSGKSKLPKISAKLCDFGYAVILDDYKSEKMFQARIGSLPWMAPELDAEEQIRLEDLHKTDIYSFGLLFASILTKGCNPFDSLAPEEIFEMKLRSPDRENSAVSTVMNNIKEKVPLTEHQEDFILALLTGTCAPSSIDRVSLAAIQSYVFLGLMQELRSGKSTYPLHWFKDFRRADGGYKGALAALDKKHSKKVTEIEDDEMLVQLYQIHDDQVSAEIGNPELEKAFATCFEDYSLEPGHLRRLKRNKTPDYPRNDEDWVAGMEQIGNPSIVKVPDFAFENRMNASLLPRVALGEVLKDLKEICDSGDIQDPTAPLHLAAAYLNERIAEPNPEKGLEYLIAAAKMNCSEAVSVILNVFDACETPLPPDDELELLGIVEEYGTRTFGLPLTKPFHNFSPKYAVANRVLGKIWTEKWPERYQEFLDSGREMPVSFVLRLNSLFFDKKATKETAVFEFGLLSFKVDGHQNIEPNKIREFKEEVTRFGSLNLCDEWGFTLLQYAAMSNDIDMAKALVDLGADVNLYGNTHSLTPLLLSSHCGHFEMTKMLFDNGADPAIRETLYGTTVLHALSQFCERQQCEEILEIALSADLDINVAMKNGATPLHTMFASWDYSSGVASDLLLENGADPTRQVQEQNGFLNISTSMTHAAENLDVDLLQRMLSVSQPLVRIGGVLAQQKLCEAKAQALSTLFQRSQFYCMCVGGSGYRKKVQTIITLLVDDQTKSVFMGKRLTDKELPTDPLMEMCTARGCGFFIEAYLNAFPKTVIDDPSLNPPRLLLHAAIERRNIVAMRAFLRQGADILYKERGSRNALHVATQYFPGVLTELIETLESLPPEKRQGKTITEILEEQSDTGHTIFAQLLAEGYDDERKLAESLRAKYSLKHDYEMNHHDGLTFGGSMVLMAAVGGLVPVENIQYLFNLKPPLEFVVEPTGTTLLSVAVGGFSASRETYDNACHQITRMILSKYPAFENIMSVYNAQGQTVLHCAAQWSNKTALQMIKDHFERHFPRRPVPWNTQANGGTVLDWAWHVCTKKSIPERHDEVANKIHTRTTRKAALDCYVFLRENGAMRERELEGLLLEARLVMFEPDVEKIGIFISTATQALQLGPPHVDGRCLEVGTTTDPDGRLKRVPVVDLIWRHDRFLVRFLTIRVSSFAVQGLRQFQDWVHKRATKDESSISETLGLSPGVLPFMTQDYEEELRDGCGVARWKRPGVTWTKRERDNLKEQFVKIWDTFFGEVEQEFMARLNKASSG